MYSMNFGFINNPMKTDVEESIESKLKRVGDFKPMEHVALLHTDVSIWMSIGFPPLEEWFVNRMQTIRKYNELNWKGLGFHLKETTPLFATCDTIQHILQKLVREYDETNTFTLQYFQNVLIKIDYLFANVFHSSLETISDPTIIHLLTTFGVKKD